MSIVYRCYVCGCESSVMPIYIAGLGSMCPDCVSVGAATRAMLVEAMQDAGRLRDEVRMLARELLRYLTMGVFNRDREQVEARISSPNCCPATKADSVHIIEIAKLAGGWWVNGEFKESQ